MSITPDDLDNRFTHHPPQGDSVVRALETVRREGHLFAEALVALVPAGRELSLALTKVEEAVMWANAGIARNQERLPG
jgi:hypothetical protein